MNGPYAAQMSVEALAREAGLADIGGDGSVMARAFEGDEIRPELERFAALVRAHALEEAARVCEGLIPDADEQCEYEASAWLHSATDAIRAIAATKLESGS